MTDLQNPKLNRLLNSPQFHLLLLFVITLLAVFLRFYKLGEWSFWIEEHHSYRHTMAIVPSIENILSIRGPFYLLSKFALDYLGWNEFNSRIIPALVGIITIPFIYWLSKKLFGAWIALLAAILLAVSPWHLYWSQNFRFYTLFLVLYNVAFFSFFWGLEKDKIKYFILSMVAILVAGLIQGSVAAFLVPIVISYLLLLKLLSFGKPPGLQYKYIIYSVIFLLLCYIAFEAYTIFIREKTSLVYKVYYLFINQSTASFVGYSGPYVMLTSVIYYVGVPLAFLALVGTIFLLKEKSRTGLFLTLGAFGHLAIFMVLTLFASTANRYVFMSLPCWIILGAVAIKEMLVGIKNPKTKITVVGILVGLLFLLMKDPVIEDIVYYSNEEIYFGLIVLTGGLVCAFTLILFTWLLKPPTQDRYFLGLVSSILLLILLHPILADIMYFTFQHGHRNNWKAVAAVVKKNKVDDDNLFTFLPDLSSFYIGGQASHVSVSKLETAMNSDKNFWLVESDRFDKQTPVGFEEWMKINCNTVGVWDQFVAGKTWKMRAYLCTPNRLTKLSY